MYILKPYIKSTFEYPLLSNYQNQSINPKSSVRYQH